VDLDPFPGLYAAVTRQSPDVNPAGGCHPEQRLSLDEALRGYTLEAAYAEFAERDKGSLEPGKLADFLVLQVPQHAQRAEGERSLTSDLAKLAPRELLDVRVLRTYVGGALVYDAQSAGGSDGQVSLTR
jgi:predicted amidohydrolase YtcJ